MGRRSESGGRWSVVNRALGEVREAQHHLDVACEKGYLAKEEFAALDDRYDHCGCMLEKLHQALSRWAGTTRTGDQVREHAEVYGRRSEPDWQEIADLTEHITSEFW